MGNMDWLTDALPELSAAVTIGRAAVEVRASIARALRGRERLLKAAQPLFDEFRLGPSSPRTFRLSSDHPTHPRLQAPSADLAALGVLIDPFLPMILAQDAFEHESVTLDLDSNIVLIGSPESEPMTRLVFGYESAGASGYAYANGTIRLPYRWNEHISGASHALCLQRRPGGGIAIRPNWPLVASLTGGCERSTWPYISNGFLSEDYLLITRVPNFLSERALTSGKTILSVAGLHGVGTRAVELLFRDARLVGETLDRIDAMQLRGRPLQALFSINSIDHDSPSGSVATSLRLVDVAAVAFSDDELTEARRTVASRVLPWLDDLRSANRYPQLGREIQPPFSPEDYSLIDMVRGT